MGEESRRLSATELLGQPITLPCGLTLPNRLVKCPMQETLATPPLYDPPIDKFRNLYKQWANANYGLIITGQVQIDIRYLSIKGDVVCHEDSMKEPHFSKWKEWAQLAQAAGTPCIVQLAHPGRMSPAGAGNRPADMAAICPSSVSVKLGEGWLNKKALGTILGTPREATLEDIDYAVAAWVRGARLAKEAGFAGCQLHGAHGFLLSQFLSPHTNRRTDEYGGSPEKRLTLLKRLVKEIREICPRPYCLSVKLNSADYMGAGCGLSTDEGLEQVRWLVECGDIDFVEISGGNAENKTSKLHNSFGAKTMDKAPKMSESTRIREAYFTEFAERVQELNSSVPIQLSGGFRSRTGMADAIESGVCSLIGLGRSVVLQPDLPTAVLLNPSLPDDQAFAQSHVVKGQWFANMIPVKVVGSGLAIQFFYHNMRRMGHGLKSDPDMSIPSMVFKDILETFRSGLLQTVERILQSFPWQSKASKID
ncbi:hypothetical protein OEA41_000949 [Lepraria neglecta]|uniref:NADH:flavin oxidoreductase/NADH oxidase N-terminal domain-containing protein n=1 Tax=Lepraria neglecta TaxID=209136 RepID=A0AAE0DQA0_9LECA|nr:hypothetical protein OEA41_000949 [Lepraria neglecta]